MARLGRHREMLLFLVSTAAPLAGATAFVLGWPDRADGLWIILAYRTPSPARVVTPDGSVVAVDAAAVRPGDRLLVGSGEILPVDGGLLCDASPDESAISGEPLPVSRLTGETVNSVQPGNSRRGDTQGAP